MTKDDIVSLWKSIGWNNSKDYHDYLYSSQEELGNVIGDCLHPSNVNVKEFWKATDEVFFTDTIANCNINNGIAFSVEKANFQNHLIPLYLGLYGGMEFAIYNSKKNFKCVNVGEIGCGYGSFDQHFIKPHHCIDSYFGFDIIPRTTNTIELGDDGTFTETQVELYSSAETFNIFYSCNVFQHLSEQQILKYLNQVYTILPYGGYFVFSYVSKPENGCSFHYGQKIEIMDTVYFKKKICEAGFKIWFTYEQNCDIVNQLTPVGFVLEKV